MKDLKQRCEDIYEEIVGLRRTLHAHPDLGMECERTVKLISDYLAGISVPFTVTPHGGVIAEIKGSVGDYDRVILMRSDMDALPLEEETGLPFASCEKGRMHACGHDMHTAIMLGSAKLLNERRNEYAGTVRLLFQPGEEISEGARAMIEDGVMEGVSIGYALHMDPLSPVGTIRVKSGEDWAAVDRFTITVHGRSAHGAMPYKGADATVAASALVLALQTMVSRSTDPTSPLVVTVGIMESGTSWNIISNRAVLKGTCRSFDRETYEQIPSLLDRMVTNVPLAYGCTGEIELIRKTPPLRNDPKVYELVCQSAAKVIGRENILEGQREMIGEDFSCIAELAPSCFVHLGGGSEYPLHSSHVIFQEESIKTGIATEVQFAIDALEYLNQV